jgi:hypothetical protein
MLDLDEVSRLSTNLFRTEFFLRFFGDLGFDGKLCWLLGRTNRDVGTGGSSLGANSWVSS